MIHRLGLSILAFFCLVWPGLALAQSGGQSLASAKIQGFTITADNLTRDVEKGTVFIDGHVKIIYQNQYIDANSATIDLNKKQVYLVGKVRVQSPQYEIGGQEIKLDYESGQGLIYYGFVQSNNIRFQGNLIEKISDTEFYVADADYTTCSNCPSTWSFQGQQIKAELGGYAYLKNTTFKVSGLPIFWLPYLAVPLKSDRQTGLLAPEIGYVANRKFFVSQSLFWALDRSNDTTITLRNYELGGVKPLVEYRYKYSNDTYGTTNASYLRDNVFSNDSNANTYRQPAERDGIVNRYGLRSYNQYGIDDNTKIRLQLNMVSDLQYPQDFNDEFKNYSDPALENRLSISHQMTHAVATLDASYYRNLLSADPLASNSSAVHRLPELRFDSTYYKLGEAPVYFKFESSFTQFVRSNPYDNISTINGQKYVTNSQNDPTCEHNGIANCNLTYDGNYDPTTDQIRTGKRANLKTSLTTDTFNIGNAANVSPTLSFNETQYFFPVGNQRFNARHYVQFDLNSRTKFYRVYDGDFEKTQTKYKHEIIPEIQYSVIPWMEQEANPFFGNLTPDQDPNASRDSVISNSDLNSKRGLQYDFDDRTYDRNVIAISLLNRVIRKKRADDYKTLLTFRITQAYDLYQKQYGVQQTQPLSNLKGSMVLDLDQIQSSSDVSYSPYQSATNSTTTVSYRNEKQQYFKVGLISNRIETQQDDVSFAIGFVSPYVNVLTGVVFDASANRDSNKRLKRTSLITQFKPPGECWAVNFFYDQKESLQGEWKFKFDFSFDGKPTKVIPPEELKIN
ncbi:MAG: LPS assembly protein LptD [Bdellovibrio sp.]|nr:LPS assembly protein LptD [Bdellovibrio sp.]